MDRRLFAASTLSAALGLAIAAVAVPVQADGMSQSQPAAVKDGMAKPVKQAMEKCYGVNAVGKNDCAQGTHSCAGEATKARDAQSYVFLPAGVCSKIEGGSVTPA
jgi:uncharacterized membrane protein